MKRINWPMLGPNDIEVRIASCKDGKTTLLLYQNSRTAMNAFDCMFGEFGWQCEYYDAGGQMYCRIGVWDEEKSQWIWKSDTGSESNIEAEKGFSSDCFKRVAVRWGYARELYSAPRIIIKNDNKFNTYYCRSIGYDNNRKVNQLTIVDRFGNVVFNWANGKQDTVEQPSSLQEAKVVVTDRIPPQLYGIVCNASSLEFLKKIWDENQQYHSTKVFKNLVNKRKKQLQTAS